MMRDYDEILADLDMWASIQPEAAEAIRALLDRVDEMEAEIAAVKVDADRYKDAVSDAFTALGEVGEINPCNYDHDHVCQMNAAYCEAFNIIYEATAPEQEGE